jgi:acyl-CoA reductase-like NAD-dependent aldehyde dehydrogenase
MVLEQSGTSSPEADGPASTLAASSVAMAVSVADAAQAAFPVWSGFGPNARRGVLEAAARALENRGAAITEAMVAETGATVGWAQFNLRLAVSMVREAAAMTTQICGEVIPSDKPGCLAMTIREPAGVVLGIAPWNAPIILGVRAIATPLACGNTVVLKASELCPRTHSLIAEAFAGAGFPPGSVGLVTNAPQDAGDIVGALIDHPAIRRINFTGSTAVGKIIAKRAAEHLKPVLLELGGKAPLIVLDDADIDEAVNAAAFGAFLNQGQICMSTERIILHAGIADVFVSRFQAKVRGLGRPGGPGPLGAVVDRKTVNRVLDLVRDAVDKGADLICGGDSDGVLMPPHAVDHVMPSMRLFREESFGPVVALIRAATDEDAVRIANDSEYGLSAAVFTRDIARGVNVARSIRSGMCHINGPTVHDEAQMPFGGTKASGYGRFGGKAGIEAFTELKWITVETLKGQFPF